MNLRITSVFLTFLGIVGVSQGEDFISSTEDLAQSLDDVFNVEELSAYGLQCLNGDLAKVPFAEDPFEAVIGLLENYCDEDEALTFESALEKYEQCSSYDVAEFIETFWSALVGMGMKCLGYGYQMSKLLDDFPNLPEMPLPRIPDECATSFLGHNPFGNFLRYHSTQPEKEMKCLAQLNQDLPYCTLRRWPIPIVGEILKFFACFSSKLEDVYSEYCNRELKVMSGCLPPLAEMENANDQQCQKWLNQCTVDLTETGNMPSINMFLPPPLSSAPIADICKGTVVDDSLKDVPNHYEAFQNACFTDEDVEFWTEATTKEESASNGERNMRSRTLLSNQ